jgi:SAM-dependent methyltransferase
MTDAREAPGSWAVGEAYEAYVGRWSRHVADEFIDWLAVAPGARWLDVGSGTGVLASRIAQRAEPARVDGVDPSPDFVAFAQREVEGVSFGVGSAEALSVGDGEYDVVVSGLVLNFVPDPRAGLREMARATAAGGTVAGYVWDYAGEMQLMRHFWDAAVELDPSAADLDEGRRFPICRPDALETLTRETGLDDVEVRAIDVPTTFADFDDYWSPFDGGQGPAPAYAMSLEKTARGALRERLRETLRPAPDGKIALTARAWAYRGTT